MCRKQGEGREGLPRNQDNLMVSSPSSLSSYHTDLAVLSIGPKLHKCSCSLYSKHLRQTVRILGQLMEQPLQGPGLPATSTVLLPSFRIQIPGRSFLNWLSLNSTPTAWFAGRGSIWPLWLPWWKLGTTSLTTHNDNFPSKEDGVQALHNSKKSWNGFNQSWAKNLKPFPHI